MLRSRLIKFVIFMALIASSALLGFHQSASAVRATDFNAGNIISDAVFYNKNAMTLTEIESFLWNHTVACDTWGTGAVGGGRYINGAAINPSTTRARYSEMMKAAGNSRYHAPPYVCLTNYYENPDTHRTSFDSGATKEPGMLSAAEIIYRAAQTYNINPQVLLVTLKKEYSYVFTDNWPLRDQYNTVMGYGCPDSGPNNTANCSDKYYGFYNQVMNAAWQFDYYKQNITRYNYQPYRTNYIQYSPNASCGVRQVYIENVATASLYIYTPYTPNVDALANYPGTADCGAYGNRNFFMFFNEWFGSAQLNIPKSHVVLDGVYTVSSVLDVGKVLDAGSGGGEWDNVYIYDKLGTETQKFEFKREKDGFYRIRNLATGKYLDVDGSGTRDHTKVWLWSGNETCAQRWAIVNRGGYYVFYSACSGKVLDLVNANTTNSTAVQIYGENGTGAQGWKLSIVSEADVVTDGVYGVFLESGMALEVAGGGVTDGVNVQIWEDNKSAAQVWEFIREIDGLYTIRNIQSGKVLEAAGGRIEDGTNAQIYAGNGTCAQRWLVMRNQGGVRIMSSCSGKSLEAAAGRIWQLGVNVQIYAENETLAQKWTLRRVSKSNSKEEFSGSYVLESEVGVGRALDVEAGRIVSGTNVQVWEKNYTLAQRFEFVDVGGGYYGIRNVASGLYLDVLGSGVKDGTNVWMYDWNGTCAQRWAVLKEGDSYVFRSACSDRVLDVDGGQTANGTNIQIWGNNGTVAQRWKLEKL